MPRFVGLDVHKRFTEACILCNQGQRLWRGRVQTHREDLVDFAKRVLRPSDQVALEATSNTWTVVDLLEPFVDKVVVSNPLRTRAIASAKVKTDRIDAKVLAELLRCDYLPQVWQPDAQTRRQRRRLHARTALRRDSTRLKNRLHAQLSQRLIVVPFRDLFSAKARAWLKELEIDPLGRASLDVDLRLLAAVEEELAKLEQEIAEEAYPNEPLRLLMTLPGVDVTVAQGVLAAWGDIRRFPSADRAASYLGLTPSTRQSGARCYHGSITKQGNGQARSLLVQAAQHVDRHPGPLGVFFRRLAKRKNRNVAVVATARKLALVAWHMLKNKEPYRYAQPSATQNKLARLRVRATGQRRRGGIPKGAPRPEAYGTGRGSKTIPSLGQLCASENLPPAKTPQQLPPGEIKTLANTGTLHFAKSIQEKQIKARKTTTKRITDDGELTSS